MKTSPRGIEDLVLSEGLRLKAYRDSVGVWTIGYGHAATSGRPPIPKAGMVITVAEAKRILAADLAEEYEPAVNAVLGPVPQHVFDGAVSFHFNTGAVRKASWPAAYKRGNMAEAERLFKLYKKPPEIIGRRRREADLIFRGKYHSKPGNTPATPAVPLNPLLRKGDGINQGSPALDKAIKEAQRLLADRGFTPGSPPDGMFGAGTEAMVKAFQRQRGLTADGVIGPETWAALRQIGSGGIAAVAPVPPPPDDPGPVAPPARRGWLKGVGGSDGL